MKPSDGTRRIKQRRTVDQPMTPSEISQDIDQRILYYRKHNYLATEVETFSPEAPFPDKFNCLERLVTKQGTRTCPWLILTNEMTPFYLIPVIFDCKWDSGQMCASCSQLDHWSTSAIVSTWVVWLQFMLVFFNVTISHSI